MNITIFGMKMRIKELAFSRNLWISHTVLYGAFSALFSTSRIQPCARFVWSLVRKASAVSESAVGLCFQHGLCRWHSPARGHASHLVVRSSNCGQQRACAKHPIHGS